MRPSLLVSLLAAVVLLAACRPGEVPLPAHPLAAFARTDEYPRENQDAVPMREGEHRFDGCGIERVYGQTLTEARADGTFLADQPATMTGWAYPPDEAPGIPQGWIRMLPLDPSVPAAQFPLVTHLPRPDVATSRSHPPAAFAGFTRVVVDGMPAGRYHAQVVYAAAAGRWACANVREVELR